jgi:phosphoglycerate dehydrogenase-like enzyme
MIIYTDLYNRTKNYSLPSDVINNIQKQFDVTITTDINSKAEVYWGDRLTDMHLLKMPELKWIHLSKTGFGKFNLPTHTVVTNTPESSNGVAEYAVTGVLYLLRGIDRMPLNRLAFDKHIDNIIPFNQVRCLVVGHGRIGKEVNKLLTALGMQVEFVTRTVNPQLDYSKYNFIINALPLTNETKDYFGAKIFGRMNKNSYIINVGRGETINEHHLYEAIKSEQIRGAFLDVVKKEPINKDNKLLSLNNVYISPHVANAMYNSVSTQVKSFTTNLEKYKNNKKLKNIIL